MRGEKCAKPTCDRKAQNGGLCKLHYQLSMRGRPVGLVDSTATRERIALLRSIGMGTPRIGELAGIPQVTVWRASISETVMARTEHKILSIPVNMGLSRDGALISALGSRRRLQALQVNGWTCSALMERVGVNKRAIVGICTDQPYVTVAVARRIAEVFRELEMTDGGNQVTRRRSLSKGWSPPLAWRDIDDPSETPDRRSEGRVDWFDEFQELRELGLTQDEAASHLGVDRDVLWRRLDRLKKGKKCA